MSTRFTHDDLRRLGYAYDGKGGYTKSQILGNYSVASVAVPLIPEPNAANWSAAKKSKLNGNERRWLEVLKSRHPSAIIIPQFRLRVGDLEQDTPVHYTADFAVFHAGNVDTRWHDFWHLTLWETKDKRRGGHSDELTRPKLVRKNNPFVAAVYLATWDGTNWEERLLA